MFKFYLSTLVLSSPIDSENCSANCTDAVSICSLNAKKVILKKDQDINDQILYNQFIINGDEIEKSQKYDHEVIGSCHNCNPEKERKKYGNCPCCEVKIKFILINYDFQLLFN